MGWGELGEAHNKRRDVGGLGTYGEGGEFVDECEVYPGSSLRTWKRAQC
jgi:hypothetical protein